MNAIWKFQLKVTDLQEVEMPKGAQVMSVQEQNGALCLWAAVDSEQPKENRVIEIIGTGNPIPTTTTDRHFIGTAQMQKGALVWHVFERK